MKTSKQRTILQICSFVCILSMLSVCCAQSQEYDVVKKKYKAWTNLLVKPFKIKGFLYEINDSSITLAKVVSTHAGYEQKGIIYGIPLAVLGAGIGASIGSIKLKFSINGNIQTFQSIQKDMEKYAIRKR
ncbi:MAG: hypothetical protein ABFS05_05480 [Bacteroidota bacterium]